MLFLSSFPFSGHPTCGLVCPDRSTIYFAWDKRRRDQILSCRVGSRPGDSNTVVSLVPRRRIERLSVSNVSHARNYPARNSLLVFQEYRIFQDNVCSTPTSLPATMAMFDDALCYALQVLKKSHGQS